MGFDKEVFAAKLRGKRAEANLNQLELANKTGIGKDTILKYENGTFVPGADKLYALAEELGCTPDYLMGWDIHDEDTGHTARGV